MKICCDIPLTTCVLTDKIKLRSGFLPMEESFELKPPAQAQVAGACLHTYHMEPFCRTNDSLLDLIPELIRF